jgi:hypothetical protein
MKPTGAEKQGQKKSEKEGRKMEGNKKANRKRGYTYIEKAT